MNKKEQAKLRMYNAVISYCHENPVTIASIPALQSSFTLFVSAVSAITVTAQQQARIISGIAEDKSLLRTKLAQQAIVISSKVFAYANSIGNNELKQEVGMTVWQLLRLKHEELDGACRNIAGAATANIAALEVYKITAGTIKDFTDNIDIYVNAAPRPRNAVSQRAAHVKSLRKQFLNADNILKSELDKIIADFKITNTSFYQTYKGNRIIIDPRSTPTQIKGAVTNNSTDEPITGATIEVLENETMVSTTVDGKYVIKPLPPGTYSLKISMEGFQPKTVTGLLVKLGQITTMDMTLSPAV